MTSRKHRAVRSSRFEARRTAPGSGSENHAVLSEDDISSMRFLFVTGTRADFGKIEPLAIASRDAGFDVEFFVTGMHLLMRYGRTAVEVRRVQGTRVFEFHNQRSGDRLDVILGKTMSGFSDYVAETCPDLVILHGDRVESLACALVCATNYIRCAHIEGGEVSGTIDEHFRHCNSKLATCHFVSSAEAGKRVLKLGEAKDSVFVIGSPEIDFHATPSGVGLAEVRSHYDIHFDDYGILIFHPVTSETHSIGQQAAALFQTLVASGKKFVTILPNNDPGSDHIFREISRLPKDRFRCIPSMRFSYFSELLRNASAVIGNSSVGVREAPYLGVPSLDVGSRQYKRASAPSCWNCSAFDSEGISRFLSAAWGKRFQTDAGFGDGNAADRFLKVVKSRMFWDLPLQKSFHDNG